MWIGRARLLSTLFRSPSSRSSRSPIVKFSHRRPPRCRSCSRPSASSSRMSPRAMDEREQSRACGRSPRLRENYVWWKLGFDVAAQFPLCLAPFRSGTIVAGRAGIGRARLAASSSSPRWPPRSAYPTANPKTFIVGFLTFWYVVVNDKGANPLLDFAGFYGKATGRTIMLYSIISVVMLTIAQGFYCARLEADMRGSH